MEGVALNSLKEYTEKVCENLFVPKSEAIEHDIKQRHGRQLTSLKATDIFNYRVWQARQIGFRRFKLSNLVEEVMGSSHTHRYMDYRSAPTDYEWMRNHHTRKRIRWYRQPTIYDRRDYSGFWLWRLFYKKLLWRCRYVTLSDMKKVPDHVMLKILEIKVLNIFNCFNVLEPIGGVPVLVGTILEFPPSTSFDGKKMVFRTTGKSAHYYICDWKP
jgi:hypothetical protein